MLEMRAPQIQAFRVSMVDAYKQEILPELAKQVPLVLPQYTAAELDDLLNYCIEVGGAKKFTKTTTTQLIIEMLRLAADISLPRVDALKEVLMTFAVRDLYGKYRALESNNKR